MVLTKLIRQYGRYRNEYSTLEIGDTLNELLDELKKTGLKVVEEAKVIGKPATSKPTEEAVKNRVGEVVRTEASGDRVYFVLDGKKQWVESPDILRKLGFNFPDVKIIEPLKLSDYEDGDVIDKLLGIKKPLTLEVTVKKEDNGETKTSIEKYSF
jgi:hypothetical protein